MTIDIHTSSNFLKDDGTKESYHLPESATPMQIVDALLKSPESVVKQIKSGQVKKTLFILLGIFFLCHAIYGLIVGSFSGNVQWFAAPIKIVGGAALSALLCYPILVGFAPVAFIFTFSIKTVAFMGFIHISIWAISIFFGLRYIVMGLTQMDSRKDSYIIKVWCTILILTMLQMTTTLRPIIGVSDTLLTPEKSFFVEHWLDVLNNKRNGLPLQSNDADLDANW